MNTKNFLIKEILYIKKQHCIINIKAFALLAVYIFAATQLAQFELAVGLFAIIAGLMPLIIALKDKIDVNPNIYHPTTTDEDLEKVIIEMNNNNDAKESYINYGITAGKIGIIIHLIYIIIMYMLSEDSTEFLISLGAKI